MVLEDGPDKMNSDDDDALEEEHGDKLTGTCTPKMDPKRGPVRISQHEAARQRAAAQAMKEVKVPPRSQSPVGGSSDEDEPTGSEWIWSQTKGCMRKNKHFRAQTATADSKFEDQPAKSTNPFIPRPSTPVESPSLVATVNVPLDTLPVLTKGKKSGVSSVRAKKGAGKKAANGPADSEATQPMVTPQRASRAGSLRRGVGGSGQTDTCVASSHPSKT
jgi:hypothetical protein